MSKTRGVFMDKKFEYEFGKEFKEKIKCPKCGYTQKATIVWNFEDPFPEVIHQCEKCKYWITESEWLKR